LAYAKIARKRNGYRKGPMTDKAKVVWRLSGDHRRLRHRFATMPPAVIVIAQIHFAVRDVYETHRVREIRHFSPRLGRGFTCLRKL